ncbi:hypothetical protein GQ457_10G011190 [Hibiscus cannabinus]
MYSPKSFSQQVGINSSCLADPIWKLVWANIASLKVESFAWKAILRKIPIRVELAKRVPFFSSSLCCPLCVNEMESTSHFFPPLLCCLTADVIEIFNTCILHFGWWCKDKWPHVTPSISDGAVRGILMYFSKSMGLVDAATVEVLAIFEACRPFQGSIWARSYHMLIKSDCSVVVD